MLAFGMAQLISVTDPEDARVAPYRHLRERDLVKRQGGFVAEGEVVLQKLAVPGRWALSSLLISDRRLAHLQSVLQALPAETPVYAASQAVVDAIAGFPLHRGVLAFGEAPAQVTAEALLSLLPPRALVVCLMGVSNHDNLGGVFRNAAAFGADALLLDAGCCEPLYRKTIRVSVGASVMVPYARLAAGCDPLAVLERAGFESLALTPSAATPLRDVRAGGRAAVLFGSEGAGLPAELLARTRTVAIPMAGGFDSLNVATASGIVLHHLTG